MACSKPRLQILRSLCRQDVHSRHKLGLLYIFQGVWTRTFQELATRVHDIGLNIVKHYGKNLAVDDQYKEKRDGESEKKEILLNIDKVIEPNHAIATFLQNDNVLLCSPWRICGIKKW